jgi:TonB family protein
LRSTEFYFSEVAISVVDIAVASRGKDFVKIHTDLVEILTQTKTADFEPTADAVAAPARRINVSAGLMQGNLLTRMQPNYPVGALGRRVQGTVVLQGVISKTVHISELKVVSGPPDLQDAAINAVRQWVYRPYLLNGEAVEVQTQINVVFSSGGR